MLSGRYAIYFHVHSWGLTKLRSQELCRYPVVPKLRMNSQCRPSTPHLSGSVHPGGCHSGHYTTQQYSKRPLTNGSAPVDASSILGSRLPKSDQSPTTIRSPWLTPGKDNLCSWSMLLMEAPTPTHPRTLYFHKGINRRWYAAVLSFAALAAPRYPRMRHGRAFVPIFPRPEIVLQQSDWLDRLKLILAHARIGSKGLQRHRFLFQNYPSRLLPPVIVIIHPHKLAVLSVYVLA